MGRLILLLLIGVVAVFVDSHGSISQSNRTAQIETIGRCSRPSEGIVIFYHSDHIHGVSFCLECVNSCLVERLLIPNSKSINGVAGGERRFRMLPIVGLERHSARQWIFGNFDELPVMFVIGGCLSEVFEFQNCLRKFTHADVRKLGRENIYIGPQLAFLDVTANNQLLATIAPQQHSEASVYADCDQRQQRNPILWFAEVAALASLAAIGLYCGLPRRASWDSRSP